MLIFATLSILVGILLGLRFKVLVLIPATAGFIVAVSANSAIHAHKPAITLIAMAATIAALQVGYLIGAFVEQHLRRQVGKKSKAWAPAPFLRGH